MPVNYVRRKKQEETARKKKQQDIAYNKLTPENQRLKDEFRASQQPQDTTKKQQATGTAAPGVQPNVQKTVAGTTFDANLPITNTNFQNPQDYEQAVRIQTSLNASGLTPGQSVEKQKEQLNQPLLEEENIKGAEFGKPVTENELEAQGVAEMTDRFSKVNAQGRTVPSAEGFGLAMGVLIEKIPFLKRFSKYLGGVSPTGKSYDIANLMAGLSTTTMNEINAGVPLNVVKSNLTSRIDELEVYEGKIKFLVSISPELRSNPEEVQKLQAEILTAKLALRELQNQL